MRYWPLSVVAQSPLMPPAYAPELYRAYAFPGLSQGAMVACNQVAGRGGFIATDDTFGFVIDALH